MDDFLLEAQTKPYEDVVQAKELSVRTGSELALPKHDIPGKLLQTLEQEMTENVCFLPLHARKIQMKV